MKRLALAIACLALLTVAATGAWANSIPPQVTLSVSTVGSVYFGDSGGNLSMWFSGTALQCGHANCVSGTALLEPQLDLGKYWMWMTGGNPTLTGGPSDYNVNMGTSTIFLEVQLNGSQGTLMATVALADLYGGTSPYPTLGGALADSSSIGAFLADGFAPHGSGTIDATLNLGSNPSIGSLTSGHQTFGRISSGEVVPTVPEPSSLALLGTGVLGLAGLIRSKMKN